MGQIPISDTNLLTVGDIAEVRMELFEKVLGKYKIRYEAARDFLQRAVDTVVAGADEDFDTLEKIQSLIETLQNATVSHDDLTDVVAAANTVTEGHVDNTKPLQYPELTTVQRDAVVTPRAGMRIYNVTTGQFEEYMNSIWQAADLSTKKYVDDKKLTASITSNASITPTGNAPENEQKITALIVDATLNEPSGTPVDGNTLLFRIYSAAEQTLTWNAIYKPFFEALPTVTIAGKEMYLCFVYNSRVSKWDYVSKVVEI